MSPMHLCGIPLKSLQEAIDKIFSDIPRRDK
jgi:hypothetical protein